MPRMRLLNDEINNDEINKVTSEVDAKKLVKAWLPHQDLDRSVLGCGAGVRNCSPIAEFVLTYLNMGAVDTRTS